MTDGNLFRAPRAGLDYSDARGQSAIAARGDWAPVDVGNQQVVGIVLGDRIAVTGLDGLRFVPLRMAARTWAI